MVSKINCIIKLCAGSGSVQWPCFVAQVKSFLKICTLYFLILHKNYKIWLYDITMSMLSPKLFVYLLPKNSLLWKLFAEIKQRNAWPAVWLIRVFDWPGHMDWHYYHNKLLICNKRISNLHVQNWIGCVLNH